MIKLENYNNLKEDIDFHYNSLNHISNIIKLTNKITHLISKIILLINNIILLIKSYL